MDHHDLKISLINTLKGLPAYKSSVSGVQHVVRCPFCGDSRDIAKQHLSIKIDAEDDSPMFFRCLKCDATGLLSNDLLEELGVHIDNILYAGLRSYAKRVVKYNKYLEIKTPILQIPLYNKSRVTETKLQYMYERLGFIPTYEEAQSYKMILDLYEFFKLNGIKDVPGAANVNLDVLNNNYVGFLSTNNNIITFRNMYNNEKFRYFKLILNPNLINPNSFYSIPNSMDLMYTDDVSIHIAEGIFDILSIFRNVNASDMERQLYYASCGFGYISILKYIFQLGIVTNVNLNIYSDNDKSDYNHFMFLFKNLNYIGEWCDHISIHRNQFQGQKDYGVHSSFILDRARKIK